MSTSPAKAYRATTPEACFDLLSKDLSALPLLKPALINLLNELPSSSTGLGATEMRMLELIARGYFSVFEACDGRTSSMSSNTAICLMGLRWARDRL